MYGGQIYHRIYNQAFDELFLRLRGKFGGESILMKDTLRRLDFTRAGKEGDDSVDPSLASKMEHEPLDYLPES